MISIIITYYNQPEMLKIQRAEWSKYQGVDVILVDDGSAIRAEVEPLPHLRSFRIIQDLPWNWTGARNLGWMQSTNDWCLFLDIDHVLPYNAVSSLLSLDLSDPTVSYTFRRRMANGGALKSPPNLFMCSKHTLEQIGGFDEALVGFYHGTDRLFRNQLDKLTTRKDSGIELVVYTGSDVSDASTRKLNRDDRHAAAMKLRERSGKTPMTMQFDWIRI